MGGRLCIAVFLAFWAALAPAAGAQASGHRAAAVVAVNGAS